MAQLPGQTHGMRLLLCFSLLLLCVSAKNKGIELSMMEPREMLTPPYLNEDGKVNMEQFAMKFIRAIYGSERNLMQSKGARPTAEELKEKYETFLAAEDPKVQMRVENVITRLNDTLHSLPGKKLLSIGSRFMDDFESGKLFQLATGQELALNYGLDIMQDLGKKALYKLWKAEHRLSADIYEILMDNAYDHTNSVEREFSGMFNVDKNSTLYLEGL